jgi:hypothetical protein
MSGCRGIAAVSRHRFETMSSLCVVITPPNATLSYRRLDPWIATPLADNMKTSSAPCVGVRCLSCHVFALSCHVLLLSSTQDVQCFVAERSSRGSQATTRSYSDIRTDGRSTIEGSGRCHSQRLQVRQRLGNVFFLLAKGLAHVFPSDRRAAVREATSVLGNEPASLALNVFGTRNGQKIRRAACSSRSASSESQLDRQ